VAAGDPCQLPPLVASPQALQGGRGAGLGRPLFERLVAASAQTHLLRRQYRCHPALSAVPNRQFYGALGLLLCSGSLLRLSARFLFVMSAEKDKQAQVTSFPSDLMLHQSRQAVLLGVCEIICIS